MTIRIEVNTPEYQKRLVSKEGKDAVLMKPEVARTQPPTHYILTGDKTPHAQHAAGPSEWGFLMFAGKILARVKVEKAEVARGYL